MDKTGQLTTKAIRVLRDLARGRFGMFFNGPDSKVGMCTDPVYFATPQARQLMKMGLAEAVVCGGQTRLYITEAGKERCR